MDISEPLDPQRSNRGQQWTLWITSGLLLFVIAFVMNWTGGVSLADESWFLQVITRVISGDVLYRDVFFGITPLSFYVAAAFVSILGAEILVIKAVVALCFVLTALLSCRIARQLAPAPHHPLFLVAALFVYAPPYASAVYQSLAHVFFLGCFTAILSWVKGVTAANDVNNGGARNDAHVVLAGVAAGLCFAAKQNIGVYAFAALLLSVCATWVTSPGNTRTRVRLVALPMLGFGAIVLLMLLPIWWSGGMARFLEYGFLNKATYLRTAGRSYRGQLYALWGFLSPLTWANFRRLHQQAQFLLPLVTLIGVSIAAPRASAEGRRLLAPVVFFVSAAFLGVFPRVDVSHFVHAVPELLLGVAFAWYHVKPRLSRRCVHMVCLIVFLWLAFGVREQLAKVAEATTPAMQVSTLPHFRGALMPTRLYMTVRSYADALAAEAVDKQPLFLLIPQAGFYYLITGLKNPTPFDYPLVTAFGLNGEKEVAQAIAQERIRGVCLRSLAGDPLRPALLETYIQEHLQPGKNIELCAFYRPRP